MTPDLRAKLDVHRAAKAALDAHTAALARLGTCPLVPAEEPPPAPPEGDRPDPDAVAAARALLADAPTRAALARRWDDDRARHEAAIARAETTATATREAADHARALCEALRRLPSELLRRALAHLPPRPDVRLTVDEEGSVSILARNEADAWLPIAEVSTGERLRASVELRDALRAAAAVTLSMWAKLPLCVDSAGLMSGAVPAASPVLVAVTLPEPGQAVTVTPL